jgi:hypothetical protein
MWLQLEDVSAETVRTVLSLLYPLHLRPNLGLAEWEQLVPMLHKVSASSACRCSMWQPPALKDAASCCLQYNFSKQMNRAVKEIECRLPGLASAQPADMSKWVHIQHGPPAAHTTHTYPLLQVARPGGAPAARQPQSSVRGAGPQARATCRCGLLAAWDIMAGSARSCTVMCTGSSQAGCRLKLWSGERALGANLGRRSATKSLVTSMPP